MVSLKYLEDLEAGDIQHTDEILSLVLRVESLVETHHEPAEHTRVDGFWQSGDGVDDLRITNIVVMSTFFIGVTSYGALGHVPPRIGQKIETILLSRRSR